MATMTIRAHADGIEVSSVDFESASPTETAEAFTTALDKLALGGTDPQGVTVDIFDESGYVHHSHTFA